MDVAIALGNDIAIDTAFVVFEKGSWEGDGGPSVISFVLAVMCQSCIRHWRRSRRGQVGCPLRRCPYNKSPSI